MSLTDMLWAAQHAIHRSNISTESEAAPRLEEAQRLQEAFALKLRELSGSSLRITGQPQGCFFYPPSSAPIWLPRRFWFELRTVTLSEVRFENERHQHGCWDFLVVEASRTDLLHGFCLMDVEILEPALASATT